MSTIEKTIEETIEERRADEALRQIKAHKEAKALNAAAKALNLGLAGMTQQRWNLLTLPEKTALEDRSGLTPQLMGFANCRVEVVDIYGDRRRFWVGRSSGWQPCHLEMKLITSRYGNAADKHYQSVKLIAHGKPKS